MRKRNASLALRTARNLALLAGVLALGAALLLAPRWQMEGQLRAGMRADGLTGRGELLWRGSVSFPYGPAYMTVLEEDGRIYAGRLESYEGRPYAAVRRCEAPEKPAVTLAGYDVFVSGDSWTLAQVMALSLPEGAEQGRLTVELTPGDIRTADGRRGRSVMLFSLPRLGGEVSRDGQLLSEQAALEGARYTLTLWDEAGLEVSRTGGTLESLWR